jgi:Conserved TM helix
MFVQNWTDVIASSLQGLWVGIIGFLPSFIGALVVFIIGLIVAAGLSTLVEKIFQAIKLDVFLSRLGLEPYFERAGMRLRGSRFLGQLVNWFLIIVFLLAASDILGLTGLSGFLRDLLFYIPNIVVAVLIMLAAVVLGNFLKRVVIASVLSAKLHAAHFLGTLTWWASVIFGLFAALIQLQIAVSIINTLITGVIAMFALAGGLAFGLGGRDYAAHLLKKLQDHTEH